MSCGGQLVGDAVTKTHPMFSPLNIIQFSGPCTTAALLIAGLGVLYRHIQVLEYSEAGPPIAPRYHNARERVKSVCLSNSGAHAALSNSRHRSPRVPL